MKKCEIIEIVDWAGNTLFEGHYNDKRVDDVLDANRCPCFYVENCDECGETGYRGDFEVSWKHDCKSNNNKNVYEYINY